MLLDISHRVRSVDAETGESLSALNAFLLERFPCCEFPTVTELDTQ